MKAFETLDQMAEAYAEYWNEDVATSEHDLMTAEDIKGCAVEKMSRLDIKFSHGIEISTTWTHYIEFFGYVVS